MDSIALAQAVVAGQWPPEALPWLQGGLRAYLAGGQPLEDALGLTRPNRVKVRNAALMRAARILDDGRGRPPWELAGLLEQAIRRFEGDTLKRIRAGTAMELSPLNSALAEAWGGGARPLRSRRRLYDLLA
jgi:hypothetical protein